jgi:Mat/Ecp fimbriae outer membrane usher protein
MRALHPVWLLVWFALCCVNQTAWAQTSDPAKPSPQISVGMPSEFADLAQRQQVVVDLFFGDRRIGQFEVEATPSSVRFLQPAAVVAAIPDVANAPALSAALSHDLDPNSRYLCIADAPCETPRPDVAAIVFDLQRYRADLYINPQMLAVRDDGEDRFLRPYTSAPGLVDTIGLALSGGDGRSASYSLRNRAILGIGNARVVGESFYASGRGLDLDTLAGQLDRPDLRFTTGLYYATGAELIGRRRIAGVGIGSQFDTRSDRARLFGDQLILFLSQRSRVDLMIDGRLVSSAVFEAGNQSLDTSNLPDGSYPIEIRIQEASGATRSERRFFTKSTALAPTGHLAFHADLGFIAADSRASAVALTSVPLFSAGAAKRIGSRFAWNANLMATDRKQLLEIGATMFSPVIQTRASLLASATGAYGFLVQAGSTSDARLSYNFDLRHMHSDNRGPLISLDDYIADPSSSSDLTALRIQASGATYTQIAGALSFRLGAAQLGGSGYFRHDAGRITGYAVGPSLRWPLLERRQFRLDLDGSYAWTNQGRTFAVGLNLRLFNIHNAFGARTAIQSADSYGRRGAEAVSEIYGSIQRDTASGQHFSGAASLQRNSTDTIAQATADLRGPFGYAAGSVLRRFGALGSTQYGLTAQSTIALNGQEVRLGAQDQNDSVVTVRLRGTAIDTPFEVLIDGSPRGIVTTRQRATFSVPPYRRYSVRLRPVGGDLVAFDTKARTVDVYPGTVAALDWKADSVLAMFGRIRRMDGSAIANADIVSGDAIAATDDNGYFQIQAAGNALLEVHQAGGRTCRIRLDARRSGDAYTSLGDLICQEERQ